MLRVAASTLAKRSIARQSTGAVAPLSAVNFHFSARREEEAKETSSQIAEKDGFMGTGLSHLYAIPVGVALAVPILKFEWFLVNEETLLASTFIGFCVVAYTQGGDIINKSLREESQAMLKLQNEAEDEMIAKLQENLEYMKLTENIVQDYQDVMDLTKESYEKLNAAGKVRPQHNLKAQVERVLTMIAAEEQNMYEKKKSALMEEATASVTKEFGTSKELKKAALDSALAALTGKAKGKGRGSDPVQAAFVNFFKDKTATAQKADDGSEERDARSALLTKVNGIAENEGFYFRFDANGQPKMVV